LFYFLCLAAPGKTNDSVAICKTSLPAWLDVLPPGYFTAADCAYSITEHLVAPYSGPQRYIKAYDNFNFYLSQLRIRIEMAFGLLVTKWWILHTPINVKLKNLKKLLGAICRLHIFCIDNRETSVKVNRIYKVPEDQDQVHAHEPTQLGYIPTDAANVISWEGSSHLREFLAKRVADNNLICPLSAVNKKVLQQKCMAMYE
jgi:hypothetical protein